MANTRIPIDGTSPVIYNINDYSHLRRESPHTAVAEVVRYHGWNYDVKKQTPKVQTTGIDFTSLLSQDEALGF